MAGPRNVEEYLAGVPADARAVLEALRRQIKAVAPQATEVISYQMPGFRDGDRALVTYAAFKDHCSLFPMSGSVIEQHKDALGSRVTGKGTIQFTIEDPLPPTLVKKIVKARLAENEARRRKKR